MSKLLNKCPSSVLNIIFSLRKEMIDGDIIANCVQNNGLYRTFIKAISFGKLSVVEYLVSKGADIHAGDDWALQMASYNGNLPMVEYLVSKGADIHALNNKALQLASLMGHLHVVEYLKSCKNRVKIVN